MDKYDKGAIAAAIMDFSQKNGISKEDAENAVKSIPGLMAQVEMLDAKAKMQLLEGLDAHERQELEKIIKALK